MLSKPEIIVLVSDLSKGEDKQSGYSKTLNIHRSVDNMFVTAGQSDHYHAAQLWWSDG